MEQYLSFQSHGIVTVNIYPIFCAVCWIQVMWNKQLFFVDLQKNRGVQGKHIHHVHNTNQSCKACSL